MGESRSLARIGDVPSAAALRPACWPKLQHHSQGDAAAHLHSLQQTRTVIGGEVLNTYRCKACGRWHVGHTKYEGR